ncbi:MAG: AI-2E family transporter [Acidobacteria bacterium]|nr:AI-2E family transporter [Acidobacteriota bacterium]
MAETAAVAASEAAWPQTRAILRIILIVLAVAGVMWAFYALESILLLVVLAIFFAYLVAPLVEMVRQPVRVRGRERVVPRSLAIGIVYLVIFGSLFLTFYFLSPRIGNQISDLSKQAPQYLTNARTRAQEMDKLYERLNLPPVARSAANNAVTRTIDSFLTKDEKTGQYEPGEATKSVIQSVPAFLAYIPWLILVPIMAFFLLKDAESFRRTALEMLPSGRIRWRGDEFFQDVSSTLAAYIRAQLTACLLIGTICTIGFALLGVRYALVLGVVAGLLEFIPLVGPLVVAIIATLVTLLDSGSGVLWVLLFLTVLRIVHDYVVYPRLIGSGIHLHPLAVILAILSGHELAGTAGIFLAIPVVAIITVTYRHWLEHRGGTGLVAELLKPVEQPPVAAPADANETAPPVNVTPTHAPSTASARPAPTDA